MGTQLAYCTNVHAGANLETTMANLRHHALAVKSRFAPDAPMGVGLWLAAPAARNLLEAEESSRLATWLDEQGLVPFTLNGFPFGDFHEPVVKHRVYHPTWYDTARLQYTLNLVHALDAILPKGLEGSISTLPIAWSAPKLTRDQWQVAAANLRQVAVHLAELEARTGRLIYLCLEPEPGCVLQRGSDVIGFFEDILLPLGDADMLCRYLRVCHDICHTAVMFEDQSEVLRKYAEHGILVGKVQVSSAIEVDFDKVAADQQMRVVDELSSFAEDRYLHQTVVKTLGKTNEFFEDLPVALARARREETPLCGRWRVHFHVPIYLKEFGTIGTTRDEISTCLDALRGNNELKHFEVETYAWGVLPSDLQQAELADGIAREMNWLSQLTIAAER